MDTHYRQPAGQRGCSGSPQPDHHAELGETAVVGVGPFTPTANDNFALEEHQITNNRDRALILLALWRRLEEIHALSAEAVDIRALIARLSKV
jgi:hypothetical protein